MKQIIETLGNLFNNRRSQQNTTIKLIKNRKKILQALRSSLENGNIIGLYSRTLGNGMLLVGVEEITTYKTEDVIILKRYEQSGLILHTTRLLLSEIQGACPFETKYCHPANEKGIAEELINEEQITF